MSILNRRRFLYLLSAIAGLLFSKSSSTKTSAVGWDSLRKINMKGKLQAFWNIYGQDNKVNQLQAMQHGFKLSSALGTYTDYPGQQKENIYHFIKDKNHNPWHKPPFFEKVIKRNIKEEDKNAAIFVHDIEFEFEKDIQKLWKNPELRRSANAKSIEDFSEKYYREWASWFSLPCIWSKQIYPNQQIGIYGPQVFNRDYWGFSKPDELEINHRSDLKLWKYIDPHVDFYTNSVYVFYDLPDSIYYLAANIEENYRLSRKFSKKPLYTYVWLRYHSSNEKLAERELDDYLAEAAAVVPYFTGSKGIILWGWEPKTPGPYYQTLPTFINSLGRVADLSAKIDRAQLIIDEPAHKLWQAKKPLVRKLKVSANEWIIMATYPWQQETDRLNLVVKCGSQSLNIEIYGKHTEIYHLNRGLIKRISI